MDTSETYIKMCEKAKEVQASRVIANGDFEVRFKHKRGQVEVHHHREITAHYCPEDHIWLPRQDQLQEIYGRCAADEMGLRDISHSIIMASFLAFSVWLNERYEEAPYVCNPTNAFDSGEQLWLAFVMKEKYGKVWDGENWEKFNG